jgi:2-phosphosulfolactate phosphatase
VTSPYAQHGHRVRLEWGPVGAAELAPHTTYAVVVDVLSFTTTVSVALDLGATVYPYRWRDDRAAAYARERDAVLAVGRLEARDAGPGTASLSPAHLRGAGAIERLVLPSPNGSAICFGLAGAGATVLGAALRNRAAVAGWLSARLAADPDVSVTVVAAGERWRDDDSLRPALEDLLGAGAVVAGLVDAGVGGLSPEARAAAAAYRDATPTLAAVLRDCSGGRELAAAGFAEDVEVAAELDTSDLVPLLAGDAFVTAG